MIYKEQAQTRSSRHRFVRLILVGLIIFAVGTIAHCSIQLMADVQIRISSSNHPLDCSTYGKDGFPECNCMSYMVIFHHVNKLLFVFLQTLFLCLIAYKQPKPRWWLYLMISTILIVDIYLALWGLIYKFKCEHSHEDKDSPLFPDFPGVPYDLKSKCHKLAETANLYKIRTEYVQWLYPLQGEFFLCASGLLLSAWYLMTTRESSTSSADETVHQSTSTDLFGLTTGGSTEQKARNPCRGALLSTLLGAALAAIFLASNILLYRVTLEDCQELDDGLVNATHGISVEDAMVWHGSQWIVYHLITIVTTLAIVLELVCLPSKRKWPLRNRHVGTWSFPSFCPDSQHLTAAHFQPTDCAPWLHAQLAITSSILAVVDALLQTCLVFYGSRFSCKHRGQTGCETSARSERDPLIRQSQNFCIAKHLLTFLAVCDVSVWVVQSLEALNKQMRAYSAPSQYFGPSVWLNIVSCFNPVHSISIVLPAFWNCLFCSLPRGEQRDVCWYSVNLKRLVL